MKKISAVLMLFIILALCSCATIMNDKKHDVFINSNTGINIKVFNKKEFLVYDGKAPVVLTLNASESKFSPEEYTVVAYKDGYQTRTGKISAHFSGWVFVNLLLFPPFGTIIGGVTDFISGKIYYLDDVLYFGYGAKNNQ